MAYFFDMDGKPMTLMEWAEVFESGVSRKIADDVIGDVRVSTVWLGLDHSVHGPPLIFETMVFGGERNGETWRYATRTEAIAGHTDVVASIRGVDARGRCAMRLRLEAANQRALASDWDAKDPGRAVDYPHPGVYAAEVLEALAQDFE